MAHDYGIPLTQSAIKDHEAAYAYCVRLVGAVAAKNSWPQEDLTHCYEQMSQLYGEVDGLGSYMSALWEGGLFGGLSGTDLELAESWWSRFANLAGSWARKGLKGADSIQRLATQAHGGAIAQEKEKSRLEHPVTQATGAAKATAEDVADIADKGGTLIERHPWIPIAVAAGSIGALLLLLRGGGRTVVLRK